MQKTLYQEGKRVQMLPDCCPVVARPTVRQQSGNICTRLWIFSDTGVVYPRNNTTDRRISGWKVDLI